MSNKDTKRQRGNVYHLTRKHFGRSLVFSVTQRLKKKKKDWSVSLHVISAVFTECPFGGFALSHSEFQAQVAEVFGR